jgi:long-chain acyl-CoA synthetase
VTDAWTIGGLLRSLAERRRHPAVLVPAQTGTTMLDCGTLADNATALARGLRFAGASPATSVVLWAPNSPEWIAVSLAVLAASGVLMPVDDTADAAQFSTAMDISDAPLIFTAQGHLAAVQACIDAHGKRVFLLDSAEPTGPVPSWRALLRHQGDALPAPSDDMPAALLFTSGTTGAPKAFHLTHRNIASNVAALAALHIVGSEDRALLPLPLHHAYPFVVGMLSALTLGTTIILPADVSGPAILKALRDGRATTIIGVPRLYDAIVGAIDSRIAMHGWFARTGLRGLLRAVAKLQELTGVPFGRVLFAPIRRAVAPSLRILVSGGARLDAATADRLEALGWTVLTGYGLAETASLFTGNRPRSRKRGSAGKPLAAGEIRISHPDENEIGEIELRGPSVTAGYINDTDANRSAFTADGWFRTGDLGYVDRDGFLFVTGRVKEILVLGGGKKVNPEDIERIYGAAPQFLEIAALEEQGALVALVRPDLAKLHDMGSTNIHDGVRIILAELARELPSHERLSGFALTDQPLPRTRLGKYRRFMLHDLYVQALSGGRKRPAHAPDDEDTGLLGHPVARDVWDLLRQRYPAGATDLDASPALDLNLDSFAWMELTLELQERFGVHLTDADIAGIATVRDLLRLCVERQGGPGLAASIGEAPAIAEDIDRWLAPTGPLLTAVGVFLYALNWLVMHAVFRLRVTGSENLPANGPFVIAPNHVSDLDAMAIAAALPLSRMRRIYWAGDIVRLFSSAASRVLCRAIHLFPVDERHPGAAVRSAVRVLEAGYAQVWFPEGWRSPDGRLQRFLPGIGQLLLRARASAVPAWIGGTFEALPRGKHIPRFRQVTLTFGSPVDPETLLVEGTGRTDEERVARGLHDRMVATASKAGAIAS